MSLAGKILQGGSAWTPDTLRVVQMILILIRPTLYRLNEWLYIYIDIWEEIYSSIL
jgi:hypothetical protein